MTPTAPKQPFPPPSDEDKGFYNKLKNKLGISNDQFAIQVTVYVLLVIGLLCLFFAPFIGGLILGAIIGFAFADEIFRGIIRFKETLQHDEVLRGVILGVLCLAILIASPGFVIGAAIAVAIKKIVHIGENTTEENQEESIAPAPKPSVQTIEIPVVKSETKPEPPQKTNK